MAGNLDPVKIQLEAARSELLDVSLRNPLLNYRILKARGLEVVDDSALRVFAFLLGKPTGLSFLPRPEEEESVIASEELLAVPRDHVEALTEPLAGHIDDDNAMHQSIDSHESRVGDIEEERKRDEQGRAEQEEEPEEEKPNRAENQLQTPYTETVLQNRLLATYRAARTFLQEQGVNSLFFAFGVLEWYEAGSSSEPKKAPLVLVPVELERANIRERFRLNCTREEIQGNWSLEAKLGDFGLTLPLPEESDELDLAAYFDKVEQAVQSQSRWRVNRDALSLGFFSFSKYLMYMDLDEARWQDTDKPSMHEVLRSLLSDGFEPSASAINDDIRLDDQISTEDIHCVLDADSSQIKAIVDVNDGRNLIIQGPPGTGKSQTITNLIAEALAQGKKVLFVAEKIAALNVVKRRLDTNGLGDACLELHSNKTNKKHMLHELKRTLELGRPRLEENQADLPMLERFQKQLNTHTDAINTPLGDSGVTPYQAFGELLLLAQIRGNSAFPAIFLPDAKRWTGADYKERLFLVEQLQEWCKTHGVPGEHPFWGCPVTVVLPSHTRELDKALSEAVSTTQRVSQSASALANDINLTTPEHRGDVKRLLRVSQTLVEAPPLEGIALEAPDWTLQASHIMALVEAGWRQASLKETHSSKLLSKAWTTEVEEIRRDLSRYGSKWWRILSSRYRKARAAFRDLYREQAPSTLAEQLAVLDALTASQQLSNEVVRHHELCSKLFGQQWNKGDPDWRALKQLTEWVIHLHQEVRRNSLPGEVISMLKVGVDSSSLEQSMESLQKDLTMQENAISQVVLGLKLDENARFGQDNSLLSLNFSVQVETANLWWANLEKLQDMVSFNHQVTELDNKGLTTIYELAQTWAPAGQQLVPAFKHAWFEGLAERALRERPELAQFSGENHETIIDRFRKLDQRSLQHNRSRLARIHYDGLPGASGQGQVGTLRREFEKKSRHLPIRQLMLRAGNAIQHIKPVLMMSPLSIAQFVPPGSLKFDIVIFDEASQVKPSEAFGAILRGKQAVVVGDSRQLPPTNFFSSVVHVGEDEEETVTSDIESVLGLFASKGAPERMLRWHYRSRHESLIAVSNREFYDSRLLIFPSPDGGRSDTGLVFHHLPHTVYDRGRSSTNIEEAKAVVQAVMKHARTRPNLTLGVAAFSIKQMTVIEDHLELLRRQDPSCEAFFARHPHEPFFVKNLETVQGDERDVILLSLGYGRDAYGRVAMDFGPLNRSGGERRLNVLITRARLRCEVFANITADEIDLSRTNAFGVRALKTFLKYAETGHLEIPLETDLDADSPFEEAVYRELLELGYEVRKQVGSAGYFIDLAVVDPNKKGRYVLGIECDGASYHSSQSARDRDRLRQQVLEGLGWRIHRIWSTDWFRNSPREISKVAEVIENALALGTTPKHVSEDVQGLTTEILPGEMIVREDNGSWMESQENSRSYQVVLPQAILHGEELHNVSSARLADWIVEIVRGESPVHIDEVTKRIMDRVGIKRSGRRIRGAMSTAAHFAKNRAMIKIKGEFLWLPDMDVPPVRDRSALPVGSKKIEYVAPEEIDAAILKAVNKSRGLTPDHIPHVAARYLGFLRIADPTRDQFEIRIHYLIAVKQLEQQGEHLVTTQGSY